jgi:adenylosuccinate synthase
MNTIVVGLGYGDEGKGTIIDYLARSGDVHTVVRFNGGPQAGHNVVTPDGRHHTFSQFGSGTFAADQIATLLSRFMLIEPYALLNEAAHLQELGCENIWQRLMIDARCIVITPVQQAANRLRELARGLAAHGTCGQGVGETVADSIKRPDVVLRAGELSDRGLVARKLRAIAAYKCGQLRSLRDSLEDRDGTSVDLETIVNPQWVDVAVDAYAEVAAAARIVSREEVNEAIRKPGDVLFEGAQGALLDQDFGFHPHTTWSKTTTANTVQLLREASITDPPRRIGVLRSYLTRHGPGPLVTEDQSMRAALIEPHNSDLGHQGHFRVGVFDAVAARYAISFAGVDELAITHMDQLPLLPNYFCNAYEGLTSLRPPADLREQEALTQSIERCKPTFRRCGSGTEGFLTTLGNELELSIRLISHGPTAAEKIGL